MEPRTLVVLFLRGGLDGLSAVPPVFDDDYLRARPALGVRRPKPGDASGPAMLDDRFALSADLAALLPLYRDGRLAVVHAVGSDDDTLSHFEAQDQMEHGASRARPLGGGWLGRWLRARGESDPLAAVAFGEKLPESLRGAPAACAVESIDDISVSTTTGDADGFASAIRALHSCGGDAGAATSLVCGAARDSLALLARVAELREEKTTGGAYPRTDLGRALSQIALLVKKDVGLRVAAVDHGGFDTHFGQGVALPPKLVEFAEALAAFDVDLGASRDRVTTVCMTEFGRRVDENASLGTDHGRASCAFVAGGGVAGGRVVGRWPGLSDADVEAPGNLRVTTDYRDLLWETLANRFGAERPDSVFPGLVPSPPGVVR
jgi:uncharacterized protein (DUF1501 family)